jgi:uncharacterized protein (TIGR02266 family)
MDLSKPPSAPDQVLFVRCETWREFVERYAHDIGGGAMFVATERPPTVLTMLDLRLQLPEATEIILRARVVQVVAADKASAHGTPPGVGLELLEMDAERRRQIYQLIEFARWQGATNDPNASFVRTLLEISPSLPPAEIGHRLSLMPAAGARSSDSTSGMKRVPSDSTSGMKRVSSDSTSGMKKVSAGLSTSISNSSFRAANVAAAPTTPTAPKPTDQAKLKLALTEFAHKHYEAALRITRDMLDDNPGDPQALRWQHMCNARSALARNDAAAAADHYEQALAYGEDNREAREFMRNIRRDKKLNSLPFGRYFTKKK